MQSSVFPTPVGPRNRNDPKGRPGSPSPILPRRMAPDTALMASVCPTMRLLRLSSRWRSCWLCSLVKVEVSIPVMEETTLATSSAVTSRRRRISLASRMFFNCCTCLASSRSRSRIWAASSKLWLWMAFSFCCWISRSCSSFSRRLLGALKVHIRTLDAASSIRSMALSGRKRSGRYRADSRTAAVTASSEITTW